MHFKVFRLCIIIIIILFFYLFPKIYVVMYIY